MHASALHKPPLGKSARPQRVSTQQGWFQQMDFREERKKSEKVSQINSYGTSTRVQEIGQRCFLQQLLQKKARHWEANYFEFTFKGHRKPKWVHLAEPSMRAMWGDSVTLRGIAPGHGWWMIFATALSNIGKAILGTTHWDGLRGAGIPLFSGKLHEKCLELGTHKH